MDSSFLYLRELSSTLFQYQQENFLCDVIIVSSEQHELHAHSVVLASVSSKLRAAFKQSNNTNIRKNFVFRLHVAECDMSAIEMLLQYIYTGTIVLYSQLTVDVINGVVLAGQKLGLDVQKIVACLGAMMQIASHAIQETFPCVLQDEDVLLEIIERGGSDLSGGPGKDRPLEIIKVTSKLRSKVVGPGGGLDHSYTRDTQNRNKKRPKVESAEVLEIDAENQEEFGHVASVSDHLRLVSEVVDAVQCKDEVLDDEGRDLPGSCEEEGYVDNIEDQRYSATYEAEYVHSAETQLPGDVYVKQETLLQETSQDEENFIRDVIARTMVGDIAPTEPEFAPQVVEPVFTMEGSSQKKAVKAKRSPRKLGRSSARLVKAKVIHQCDRCPKSFKTYLEYADHHRTHTGEKPYVCDICGKAFGRSYTATEHRRLHTGERPYQCDTCGKRFITAGDLGKHKRMHTGEKPYKCKLCGKEMSTGRENADHRRLHAGGNVCPVCGKTFTRLHNMKEHMNGAHNGVKRYSCSVCSKQFSYSCSLRYHKRLHQEEKSIKCESCGKCFTRFNELTRHKRTAHGPEILEIDMTTGGLTYTS